MKRAVLILITVVCFLVFSATALAAPIDLGGPTCTVDPDTGQCWIDTDGDGIQDSGDNCRTAYNPGQEDNDHDGVGNACDPTPNGDPPPSGGGGSGGGGGTATCSGIVVLYSEANYTGACAGYTGTGQFTYVGDAMNDRTSSVKVASGYAVTMYQHSNFGGDAISAVTSTASDWYRVGNDAVSSIVITTLSQGPDAKGYTVAPETGVSSYYSWYQGGTVRCKTQSTEESWSWAGVYDALKATMGFRVCYIPGVKIVSFNRTDPLYSPNPRVDLTFQRYPWSWGALDSGYPQIAVYSDRVDMKVQMTAKWCIVRFAGCIDRHPWIRIVFARDNTMWVSTGVV